MCFVENNNTQIDNIYSAVDGVTGVYPYNGLKKLLLVSMVPPLAACNDKCVKL